MEKKTEQTEKVFLNWVLYKVQKKDLKVFKPQYFLKIPNFKKLSEKDNDEFYYFFYNKEVGIWNIPQKCQPKDEADKRRIEEAFQTVNNISWLNFLFKSPLFKEICHLEKKNNQKLDFLNKIKKVKETNEKEKYQQQLANIESRGFKVKHISKLATTD